MTGMEVYWAENRDIFVIVEGDYLGIGKGQGQASIQICLSLASRSQIATVRA